MCLICILKMLNLVDSEFVSDLTSKSSKTVDFVSSEGHLIVDSTTTCMGFGDVLMAEICDVSTPSNFDNVVPFQRSMKALAVPPQ